MSKKNLNILRNEPRPKEKKRKKYCGFCKSGSAYVAYQNADFLRLFLNPQGKILPSLYTGNCRRHQRAVASAIKRARQLAFLPYVADNLK